MNSAWFQYLLATSSGIHPLSPSEVLRNAVAASTLKIGITSQTMDTRLRPIITGAVSFVPILRDIQGRYRRKGTGGTVDPRYCYDTWMKHLILLSHAGMKTPPHRLAELGPGDSLGVGLMAMLCGSQHYRALDIIAHADQARNLIILEELIRLLRDHAIPMDSKFSNYKKIGWNPRFPEHIISDEYLSQCLAADRLDTIRAMVCGKPDPSGQMSLRYVTPWYGPDIVERESCDLIISHSVLEHVDDLHQTYSAMDQWLKPGGWMSHSLDYRCHGLSKSWNGYRDCPEWMWVLLRGRGFFSINRWPHSVHMKFLREMDYRVRYEYCDFQTEGSLPRSALAPRWQNISDHDFYCSHAFIQCEKPSHI